MCEGVFVCLVSVQEVVSMYLGEGVCVYVDLHLRNVWMLIVSAHHCARVSECHPDSGEGHGPPFGPFRLSAHTGLQLAMCSSHRCRRVLPE